MRSTRFVLIMLLILTATLVFAANKGSEKIKLEGGKRGDVDFPHHVHQDVLKTCTSCHELFPQKSGSIQAMISESQLKKKQVMNNCVSCHKTNKKEGKKYGPTKCNDCHKKG